ncbi:MAG: redoxin domain-containing protein [Candidatus Eisenbacteria bacterium]|uniref:Redoxin domain-containing protein n=1 Tax=Eiseniibacteriota bacterium TaxID=2212470 RepID=A0A538UA57_UNCEI|nr:MAG: redoxin domain-containing protein [Candidatus Eisenbacteria bacterium]
MQAIASLEVGQEAPDFKLRGPGGQAVTLSEFRGSRNVVLVFYPLAFSPVCSHQLPAIEHEITRFDQLGATVLGISVDSHYANTAFAERLRLSFPLLSDFHRLASAAYGVLIPESGHSGRAIFVVDRRGLVAYKDVSQAIGDPGQIPSNDRVLAHLASLA